MVWSESIFVSYFCFYRLHILFCLFWIYNFNYGSIIGICSYTQATPMGLLNKSSHLTSCTFFLVNCFDGCVLRSCVCIESVELGGVFDKVGDRTALGLIDARHPFESVL